MCAPQNYLSMGVITSGECSVLTVFCAKIVIFVNAQHGAQRGRRQGGWFIVYWQAATELRVVCVPWGSCASIEVGSCWSKAGYDEAISALLTSLCDDSRYHG